jgi:signal transduction histidine kinase
MSNKEKIKILLVDDQPVNLTVLESVLAGMATIGISEQKRAEDELRQVAADLSEADHRKSEFLATLAHELRNPLAPIRTGLDLMRMAPNDLQAMGRVHQMMDRQLGQLIHLVNDQLDVARITRGNIDLRKETVELKTLAGMALESSDALIEASGQGFDQHLTKPVSLEALRQAFGAAAGSAR